MTEEEIAKGIMADHWKTISWDTGDLQALELNIKTKLREFANQQVEAFKAEKVKALKEKSWFYPEDERDEGYNSAIEYAIELIQE